MWKRPNSIFLNQQQIYENICYEIQTVRDLYLQNVFDTKLQKIKKQRPWR